LRPNPPWTMTNRVSDAINIHRWPCTPRRSSRM